MKKLFATLMIIGMMAALALPLMGASAQAAGQPRTVTLTEQQINSSYRVSNPVRRTITNVSVDLQPGIAVIASTHTYNTRGQNQTFVCSSTWTPGITNGVVIWSVSSVMCNGAPASQDLVNQINSSIGSSWRNYWRTQRGGRVTAITVTDTEVVYTGQ